MRFRFPSRPATAVLVALAASVVLAACGGGNTANSGAPATTSSTSTSTSSNSTSSTSAGTTPTTTAPVGPLSPPPVPTGSIYVGAWVNPAHVPGSQVAVAGSQEVSQLPAFNSAVGHSMAVLHVYTKFTGSVPLGTLNAIIGAGAVPMIDWGCRDVQLITSGQDDSVIRNYAQTLKSYGKPVFLRWYWEFNLKSSSRCGGFDNPTGYVAAWQHIWSIFHSVGATNAAFVWCPGLTGGSPAAFYPGDQYVDWIGIDGYDRSFKGIGAGDFSGIFGSFYSEWVGHGKPLMVAETGAIASQQAQYIQSIQTQAPTMPQYKAIVYFDSIGPQANWVLQGAGITAFQSLLSDPYFSFRAPA